MSVTISGDTGISAVQNGSVDLSTDVTGTLPAANVAKYNYESASDPAYNTNPTVENATWLNTSTGTIWICASNATNLNVWKSLSYSSSITSSTVFDVFGDNSAVALYQFTSGSGTDTGGSYSMTTNSFSSGTGIIGTCAYGNPAYMKNGAGLNNNKVITVSVWVNTTNTGGNFVWSSGKVVNGQCRRGVRLSGNTVDICSFSLEYGGGGVNAISGLTITYGAWTHICVSKNKVYKNGVYFGTMSSYTDPVSDTYGLYIGANGAYDYGYITNETYGQPMNGSIDQMRIFNRELTADEVWSLYQEGAL